MFMSDPDFYYTLDVSFSVYFFKNGSGFQSKIKRRNNINADSYYVIFLKELNFFPSSRPGKILCTLSLMSFEGAVFPFFLLLFHCFLT